MMTQTAQVLAALSTGKSTAPEIARRTGINPNSIGVQMLRLAKIGKVKIAGFAPKIQGRRGRTPFVYSLVQIVLAVFSANVLATQVVYFNPPVGGVITCTIDLFSYKDSVLRLDTSACLGDRVFGNSFEGSTDTGHDCIGGMCP